MLASDANSHLRRPHPTSAPALSQPRPSGAAPAGGDVRRWGHRVLAVVLQHVAEPAGGGGVRPRGGGVPVPHPGHHREGGGRILQVP